MSVRADDLLKDAIVGTEKEIFNDATGGDGPSTEGGLGDRSPEEMGTGHEGQLETDEPAAELEAGTNEGATEGEVAEGAAEAGEDGAAEAGAEGVEPQRDPKTGEFVAAKPAAENEQPVDPKAKVPLSELIKERKARQTLQTELETERTARATETRENQSNFERLSQRIDQLMTGGQQAQKPAVQVDQNAPKKPDIFEDPEGFVRDLTQNIKSDLTQDFTKRYVAADLDRTRETAGEEFDKAFVAITTAAKSDPAVAAVIRQAYQSSTPGKDILSWHRRQETLRLVGDDPGKFVADTRAKALEELRADPEFRKQIVAELRGEVYTPPAKNQQAQPAQRGPVQKPAIRLPPSLNGRGGGSSGGTGAAPLDGSDRGVFESAFADEKG